MSKRSKCCIIGIPDHQAIIHVGGRVGAARGPLSFRKYFSKLKGKHSIQDVTQDFGDVVGLSTDVPANHEAAAHQLSRLHQEFPNSISIVIGGGHDHGFSHLKGIYDAFRKKRSQLKLGCINIDAHLDVRKPAPLITSGSPFFLALESGILNPKLFIEFGIQSHCNGPELWKYVENKKINVVPFQKLRFGKAVPSFQKSLKLLAQSCDAIVVSLDMDAMASAYSPGVSAPQSEGFTAAELMAMMELAGRENKVVSLGIFELNPEHDVDERTARLAATSAYHWVESALFRSNGSR